MFGKLFGKKPPAVVQAPAENAQPTDSVARLKLGAEELVQCLLGAMQTERGVHIESLLTALGSLAGFCCIDSTLKQVAAVGKTSREIGLVDVETKDGRRYYFGDPVNELLLEGKHSLWALVAGMVNHLGSQDYPDRADIAGHVAGSIGTEAFGIPRWPNQNEAGDLPINYVRAIWPTILPLVERYTTNMYERPVLFGFAIQNMIVMAKDVIPPAIAGKLIMECAVPMAKLDPTALWPDGRPA
jgi:hypothetical protein